MADFKIGNIGNWICFARKMGEGAFYLFFVSNKSKMFLWEEMHHDKVVCKRKIVRGMIWNLNSIIKGKKVFGFGVFVYEREKQRSITLNQVIVEYIIIHNTKYFTFFDVFSCNLRKDDCMNRGGFYVYR